MMVSIQDVIEASLCISCGACYAVSPLGSVEMREYVRSGMILPVFKGSKTDWGTGREFAVCPGKGYCINTLGQKLFPEATNHDIDLGRWKCLHAVRSLDHSLTVNASSGGIMTAIAEHLLGRLVQGVIVTRMAYGGRAPRVETFIATSKEDLISAQGSKYAPVDALTILPSVMDFKGRLLFIGTPCQIAGLRLIQKESPSLRDKIPFVMGNFCGGFKDWRETDKIIQRSGMNPREIIQFRYRGGGQPGSMYLEDVAHNKASLPYPEYARMTGFTKHRRCRLCVDATAELADFSCGDAWLPRFLKTGQGWSLIMGRSSQAEGVLCDMARQGKIEFENVSVDELKRSQKENLTSKKTRQFARRRLYRLFTIPMPIYDGGYHQENSSIFLEMRVVLTQAFFSFLEKIFAYKFIARVLKRYPNWI